MYRDTLAEALKPPRRTPLVDPRVARHGGTRRDPKSNYDFPGMASDSDWRKSAVHKATRFYGCFLCGQRFSGPHAAYTHLAKVHDR
jgi:7-keto-8-aminopelargonate synthetase-like enzyme